MREQQDQRGMFSRLPDDPQYWQSFTERIVADAVPQLRAFSEDIGAWWSALARFSTVLAAGAAVAIVAALLVMPTGASGVATTPAVDAYGLIPEDPLAVTLVGKQEPPSMETLLALRNVEMSR